MVNEWPMYGMMVQKLFNVLFSDLSNYPLLCTFGGDAVGDIINMLPCFVTGDFLHVQLFIIARFGETTPNPLNQLGFHPLCRWN